MKRTLQTPMIFVLVTLMLLTGLVGCTPAATATPAPTTAPAAATQPPASSGQNIELSFVTWSYGVETIADNIKKFEALNPGITVKHQDFSWLEYHDTMVGRFAANNAPDLLYGSDHWLQEWASAGWLEPLDTHFPDVKTLSSEVAPYALEGMTYNNHIYGLSYYADTMDFVYNEALLKKAGIDKAPTTWDDVYNMSKTLKDKGVNQYPIIMAWSQKEGAYPEALISMIYSEHSGPNALFDKDLNPTFNAEGSSAGKILDWLRKAYKDGLLDPASLSTAEIDQVKSMQAGAHAFTIFPQYNMAEVNKPGSGDYAGQFKIALMPGQTHATVGYVRFYAMTPAVAAKGDAYLQAAWKFLSYMGGKTDGEYKVVERWAVENGLGFAQLPLFDNPKVKEAFGKWGDVPTIREQAKLARAKEGLTTWYGTWDVFMRAEVHKAILGEQDSATTLKNMADKWNELKKQ